jgi:hypothetical protein
MVQYLVLLGGVLLFFWVCELGVGLYKIWEDSKQPQNRRLTPEEREERWGPS